MNQPFTPTMPYRPTIEQWYSSAFVHVVNTSESYGWKNIVVRSLLIEATPVPVRTPYTNVDTLVLLVNGSTEIELYAAGQFVRKRLNPGALHTIPREVDEVVTSWNSTITAAFLHLSRPMITELADATAKGDPEHVQLRTEYGFYDPFLRNLFTELYSELQNQSLFGELYAEAITNTTVLYLLRKYSNARIARKIVGGELTSFQVRIIHDYIHAHLAQKISLDDLARCLHVSVPHFERMFRATFHRPPHQYVLERRIEHAQELLREGKLSLYDVARACGFANQSHFTRHFSKFVGVSPKRFRDGLK